MSLPRLPALAEFVYGAELRERVFEPLVADLLRECGSRPSLVLRARWWLAIAVTLVACLPRAAFGRLSWSFGIDLAGRAIVFGALAFAMQWLGGLSARGAGWPPSFVTTVPFIMIPVIWRLRLEAIPTHQQRLLTVAFTVACLIGAVSTSPPHWPLRAAIVAAWAWLAVGGWRLGNLHRRHYSPYDIRWWAYIVYPGLFIIVSSWPIKIALGVGAFDSWWPGDSLIPYIVGALIGLSLKDRVERHIASR
jgi:hypothetical protein